MLLLYMNWNKKAWSVAQRRNESAEKHISGVTAQTGTVTLSVSPKLLSGQGYAGWPVPLDRHSVLPKAA